MFNQNQDFLLNKNRKRKRDEAFSKKEAAKKTKRAKGNPQPDNSSSQDESKLLKPQNLPKNFDDVLILFISKMAQTYQISHNLLEYNLTLEDLQKKLDLEIKIIEGLAPPASPNGKAPRSLLGSYKTLARNKYDTGSLQKEYLGRCKRIYEYLSLPLADLNNQQIIELDEMNKSLGLANNLSYPNFTENDKKLLTERLAAKISELDEIVGEYEKSISKIQRLKTELAYCKTFSKHGFTKLPNDVIVLGSLASLATTLKTQNSDEHRNTEYTILASFITSKLGSETETNTELKTINWVIQSRTLLFSKKGTPSFEQELDSALLLVKREILNNQSADITKILDAYARELKQLRAEYYQQVYCKNSSLATITKTPPPKPSLLIASSSVTVFQGPVGKENYTQGMSNLITKFSQGTINARQFYVELQDVSDNLSKQQLGIRVMWPSNWTYIPQQIQLYVLLRKHEKRVNQFCSAYANQFKQPTSIDLTKRARMLEDEISMLRLQKDSSRTADIESMQPSLPNPFETIYERVLKPTPSNKKPTPNVAALELEAYRNSLRL